MSLHARVVRFECRPDGRYAVFADGQHIGYVERERHGWRANMRSEAVVCVRERSRAAAAEALLCAVYGRTHVRERS